MIVIDDLSLRIGGKLLLENASCTIAAGSRVGLVGRNGAGKTSFFRALTGEINAERGEIAIPGRVRIGRLAQEAPDGRESLLDFVLAADEERSRLLAEADM